MQINTDFYQQTIVYQILKRIFFSFYYYFNKLNNKENYFAKWIYENGENKCLIRYPLNQNSLVIDVGGYKGHFSDKIIAQYDCKIIILEPVEKYYYYLKHKYQRNPKIKILNYGLSDKSVKKKIHLSNDGTSLIKKSSTSEYVKLVAAANFIKKYKHIDLMSINIEGEEYAILQNIINNKLLYKIYHIQIQFHKFIPNSEKLRKLIIKNILTTHKIRYFYPFVWEAFDLNK